MAPTAGLILVQETLYGTGLALLYISLIRLLDEWVLNVLVENYGYKTTLRVIAIVALVLLAYVLPLLKGRLLVTDTAIRRIDTSFLAQPPLFCFSVSDFLQGLGI